MIENTATSSAYALHVQAFDSNATGRRVTSVTLHATTFEGKGYPECGAIQLQEDPRVYVGWCASSEKAITDVSAILNPEQARELYAALGKALAECEAASVPQPAPPADTTRGLPQRWPETYSEFRERAERQRAADTVPEHDCTDRELCIVHATFSEPGVGLEPDACEDCDGLIDTDSDEVCSDCETQRAVETADHMADAARDGD